MWLVRFAAETWPEAETHGIRLCFVRGSCDVVNYMSKCDRPGPTCCNSKEKWTLLLSTTTFGATWGQLSASVRIVFRPRRKEVAGDHLRTTRYRAERDKKVYNSRVRLRLMADVSSKAL